MHKIGEAFAHQVVFGTDFRVDRQVASSDLLRDGNLRLRVSIRSWKALKSWPISSFLYLIW
jgi:hypothetical protein